MTSVRNLPELIYVQKYKGGTQHTEPKMHAIDMHNNIITQLHLI